MDKDMDLIVINQQEEEQLRSKGFPNIRNRKWFNFES